MTAPRTFEGREHPRAGPPEPGPPATTETETDGRVIVRQWTGREASALRQAMRLTIEGFADHLGVSRRAVDKWQARLEATTPRPDIQAALDTALRRAPADCRERFRSALRGSGSVVDQRAAAEHGEGSASQRGTGPPGAPGAGALPSPTSPGTVAGLGAASPSAATRSSEPATSDLLDDPTPLPSRLRVADIDQLERLTARLRALDHELGGVPVRDAALAVLSRAGRLLGVGSTPPLRRRLLVAQADAHDLVGWVSGDAGLHASGRRHLAHAVRQAREADEPWLVTRSLYRAGRLDLHRGLPTDALRLFRLAHTVARRTGDARGVALLLANEAWTLAQLGDTVRPAGQLQRAADELAGAGTDEASTRGHAFEPVDLLAMRGMTLLALAVHDERQLGGARDALEGCVRARPARMARSRAFELTGLAVACFLARDEPAGLRVGNEAVAAASTIGSRRLVDRLTPLAEAAAAVPGADAADLVRRITALHQP